MFTNADVTLYLYSKMNGRENYTRFPVEGVYWEDVQQAAFLKTGQRDGCSVLLVIPFESLTQPIEFNPGMDLVVKNIIGDEIDCSSQAVMSKSMAAIKASHNLLTITSAGERLYGSELCWHYELTCK